MIPLKYNIRSLRVRWVTTLLTCFAIGVVVFASVLTFGMIAGIEQALSVSSNPQDLIILRQGSNDEASSSVTAINARDLRHLPGVGVGANGEKLSSREFVSVLLKQRNDNTNVNVIIRGLDYVGRELRPDFRIVEGRDIKPGVNELITSRTMAKRIRGLGLGETFEIYSASFTVVGLFEAGGSSAESEVWGDLRDMTAAMKSQGAISVVNLRVPDPVDREDVMRMVRENDKFRLKAITEEEYFETQKSASIAIKVVAYMIAGFLTIGAMFAASNTMYAAVASRGREIGTLRAVGFSRRTILLSFVFESVVICLAGGALGCLATLPLDGLSGGAALAFTEMSFSFHIGPQVLLQGMGLAMAMGLIGGLFPAIRAIRLQITDALSQR